MEALRNPGYVISKRVALKERKIEFGRNVHGLSRWYGPLFCRSFRADAFNVAKPRVTPSLHPGLSSSTPSAFMWKCTHQRSSRAPATSNCQFVFAQRRQMRVMFLERCKRSQDSRVNDFRNCWASAAGPLPNNRLNSRLNCDALS